MIPGDTPIPHEHPPPADGRTDPELEYLKAMIDWARDDVRQVHYRVTAALAIVVLFVTQIPFDKLAAYKHTWLLFLGLFLLLAAAVCHWQYLSQVHRSRRVLAASLRRPGADRSQPVWEGLWERWGWLFKLGDVLILGGLIVLGIVLAGLLELPAVAGRG